MPLTDYEIEAIDASLHAISHIIAVQHRTLRILDWEVEQRRRQQLNLEKRIYALEDKYPRKKKPPYKKYTI